MPPKRFEGRFGIPKSHPTESLLTQALYRLPESVQPERIERLTQDIVEKVIEARKQNGSAEQLTQDEKRALQLKLARHFEDNGESVPIDIPTCVDALVESPKFLQSDKGSMDKLFEIHQVKTLQKIAEMRRSRAEQTHDGEFNPYENLFETSSGNYYLARLLNMPHLEDESEYMDHCVGTSTSYINKIKRGEVEIFSLRSKIHHTPVVTIEYDTKTGALLQVKTESDGTPEYTDTFFRDLLESIELLQATLNDEHVPRYVAAEAVHYHRTIDGIFEKTTHGTELNQSDLECVYGIGKRGFGFEGRADPRIAQLRDGRDIVNDLPILFDCSPENIAHSMLEITEDIKAYVGALEPGIFDALPSHIEHVYTKFPEERVKFREVELGTSIKDGEGFIKTLEAQGIGMYGYAEDILRSPELTVAAAPTRADLVELSVSSLGFGKSTRYDTLCDRAEELGLVLCPAEVGPQLRLQYTSQPDDEYLIIGMKAIDGPGGFPRVFDVCRDAGERGLVTWDGRSDFVWFSDFRFVFLRSRK